MRISLSLCVIVSTYGLCLVISWRRGLPMPASTCWVWDALWLNECSPFKLSNSPFCILSTIRSSTTRSSWLLKAFDLSPNGSSKDYTSFSIVSHMSPLLRCTLQVLMLHPSSIDSSQCCKESIERLTHWEWDRTDSRWRQPMHWRHGASGIDACAAMACQNRNRHTQGTA